ncbi:MAG: hypothetical protein UZ11_BCD004000795 [Bacteroidetes bacterium OLB11]|nr:MAG: hypothetical protein UZ11_BCD004000795 [Bacteroidetes bacterium OLB11]
MIVFFFTFDFVNSNLKKIFSLLLFIQFQLSGQESGLTQFLTKTDTLNKFRFYTVSGLQAGIWSGSLIGLNHAWYANYPRSSFHFYNDIGEWQQIDKVGHSFSAYFGANLSSQLFAWSGVSQKKSALLGAGMGIAYESVIEILDGYSAEWGFSMTDMAANLSGSLLFLSQELFWKEQRIQFKFSSHSIHYKDAELHIKANDLYGKSLPERILKDYNGQTYWLSANLWSFAKESKIPKWLNVAIGYGGDGMFGGYNNYWTDSKGVYHDRTDIKRIRQFYLAPDIDISKIFIKGKNKKIFKFINLIHLKMPLPALEVNTQGGVKFHPLYF